MGILQLMDHRLAPILRFEINGIHFDVVHKPQMLWKEKVFSHFQELMYQYVTNSVGKIEAQDILFIRVLRIEPKALVDLLSPALCDLFLFVLRQVFTKSLDCPGLGRIWDLPVSAS